MSSIVASVGSAPSPQAAQGHVPAGPAQAHVGAQNTAVKETAQAQSAYDFKALQKNVQEAIDRLNEQMRASNRSLNFSMDTQVNRVVITVRNSESGEVVRQIPDETVLRVAHNLKKIRGLLLNEEI